jgi:hypothetical protein
VGEPGDSKTRPRLEVAEALRRCRGSLKAAILGKKIHRLVTVQADRQNAPMNLRNSIGFSRLCHTFACRVVFDDDVFASENDSLPVKSKLPEFRESFTLLAKD